LAHFPGFDVGSYPGDAVFAAWAKSGTYKWCGFYLTSPCHSDSKFTPYTGKAKYLHSLGLGLAILYVGFQKTGCGGTQLTRAQGFIHGMDAVAKCRHEGFPARSVIFLDVEYSRGPISTEFTDYYRGWLAAVLDSQTFQPGTYCAKVNFNDVDGAARKEYALHGLPFGGPVFWIVLEDKLFDPFTAEPTDCGISKASIWQGLLDTNQTQGGTPLIVDLNTADSEDPSQSKPAAGVTGMGYTFEEDIIEFDD